MLIEQINTMDSDKAVKLVRELCAQLDSGEEGAHGNIWPGNVFFSDDGAAVLGEESDTPVAERNAVQVEFLPPELFWDNNAGEAGDVYSLGLLLYAGCNDGYLPFQPKGGALTDKERSEALRMRMKGAAIPLPSGTSPQLGAVILKALAYEPEDRYQSAGELLTALSETDEALPGAPAVEAAIAPEFPEVPEELSAAEAVEEQAVETMEAPVEELSEPQATAEPVSAEPAAVPAEVKLPAMTPERKYEARKEPKKGAAKKAAAEKKSAAKKAAALEKKTAKKNAKQSAKAPVKSSPKGKSAAPMTRKKKKTSPAIPILCVAALAVIGGAAWLGFNHGGEVLERLNLTRGPAETPEVSEPYVILPAESPEATAAPVPSSVEDEDVLLLVPAAQPEATAEPEPTPEPTPEPIVGSAVIDGMDVEPANDVVAVTTSGTNLRSGPGTGYSVEKTLSRGIEMIRTGTVNGWSQVQYEGEEYYVSSNLVEIHDTKPETLITESLDNGAVPETAAPAPADSETLENTAPTSSAPVVNSTPIVTNPGTPAITGAGAAAGSGSSTTTTTTSASANVTATRDVVSVTGSEVNLRSGPGTGYSVMATVTSGTTLQRTGTVNGWSRVTYQGKDAYVIDTYIQPVSDSTVSAGKGTLKVVSDVNVRSGANTDSSILGIARAGETLSATGITEGGKWYRVSYNGQEGYVNRKLVTVQEFSLVGDKSGTATVTTLANIRSGPGTGYSVLGQASQGQTLNVTGYADNNWYKVDFNGQTGYIAGSLINIG